MLGHFLADLRRLQPGARRFLWGSGLLGAARAAPLVLLALYLDRRGLLKAQIGAVLAAEGYGMLLIVLPAALLLARWRTPPLLVASAMLAGLGYALLPWLPTLSALLVCNLLGGLAWWLHNVAVAPFLFRHSSATERPTLYALAEAVHNLAAVLGALLAGLAVKQLTPYFAAQMGPQAGETRALAWVLSCSGALCLAGAACYATIRDEAPPARDARVPLWPLLRANRGVLGRFLLPKFVVGCGAGLCIPFLGLYFQERFEFSPTGVAHLQSAGQVVMSVGLLCSPWLVRRLGFVKSIAGLELASIPFFLILAFCNSMPLAVLAFLLRGALMNSTLPINKNFLMEVSPAPLRALQNALEHFAWGLAWVAGPYLGGMILDRGSDNYQLLMLTTVGFYALAALLTLWLQSPLEPQRARPSAQPDEPAEEV